MQGLCIFVFKNRYRSYVKPTSLPCVNLGYEFMGTRTGFPEKFKLAFIINVVFLDIASYN